ncbi:MAG: hypothetical protein HQM09_14140 [Candidatus Riflebacteria bacterium]|nr:hypothetical protein [Candidatus Riflebacteria bacterium]
MKRVVSILAVVAMVAVFVTPGFAVTEKEWTFAVFLNAHNNLDQYGVSNLEQMTRVGSNDNLNIVSMTDRESDSCSYQYIEKGNIKTLQELGSVDMGDYKVLEKFGHWVKENYPAKHYVFIVWNHGSGWNKDASGVTKGISYDDGSGNHITTPQLGQALADIKNTIGQNIDIFGMDACLMQMMEVSYEIKDSCDYILGSEQTEPGDGYPYDNFLKCLTPGVTAENFGIGMVKEFATAYSGGCFGNSDVTTSLVKTSALSTLKDAIDGFAKVAIAGKYAPQFKTALTQVQKFYYATNIDLIHFATLIKAAAKDQVMKDACQKLLDAAKAAIPQNGATGQTMKNANGLAIYFPISSASFDKSYSTLAYAQAGQWDEMVFDYYKKAAVKDIVSDLQNGSTNALADFVRTNNDAEIAGYVVSAINFAVYCEGGFSKPIEMSVKNLISELNNK